MRRRLSIRNNWPILGLLLAAIAVGLAISWRHFPHLFLPQGKPAKNAATEYLQQTLSDLDFFQTKLTQENQWIYGAQVATLSERAFRLTNDVQYLAIGEQAAAQHLAQEDAAAAYAILASIDLTQHRFADSLRHAIQATQLAQTEAEKTSALSAHFDAAAAFGDMETMQRTLQELTDVAGEEAFATLVRRARLIDRLSGDTATAAQLFRQACQTLTDTDDIWSAAWCATQAADFRFRSGEELHSLNAYLNIIITEVYPDFPPALILQAQIAAWQGNFRQSQVLISQSLNAGGPPEDYLVLAELHLLQENPQAAEAAWRSYLETLGAHQVAAGGQALTLAHIRGLVAALQELDNAEESIQAATRDQELRPHDPGTYHALATLYLADNSPEQALAASQQISGNLTLTGEEALVRGAALQQLGRTGEAAHFLTHARMRERDIGLRARRLWGKYL